jgi:hypothetical protein
MTERPTGTINNCPYCDAYTPPGGLSHLSVADRPTETTSERFAILFEDGSLNVSSEGKDLGRARKLLGHGPDEEGELVKVEINIKKLFAVLP